MTVCFVIVLRAPRLRWSLTEMREFPMAVTTGHTYLWPWPAGPAVTPGVERYWQLLQRQAEINRQVALGWTAAVAAVAAVTPAPGAVLVQDLGVEMSAAGHRDAERAAERSPADPSGTVGPTVLSDERDRVRNDLFDGIVDGLIDADIKATL